MEGSPREGPIDRLTGAAPTFPNWRENPWFFDDDGTPLGHLLAIELCAHLLGLLETGQTEELDRVLQEAERLIDSGDQRGADLASAGVVEGLYQMADGRFMEFIRDR